MSEAYSIFSLELIALESNSSWEQTVSKGRHGLIITETKEIESFILINT